MPAKVELLGKVFGKLTVISENGKDLQGAYLWRCQCECGKETVVRSWSLRAGDTKSCGCLAATINGNRLRTHGMVKTKLYERWAAMKNRCLTKSCSGYENYGGRGIKVCTRWYIFESFLSDMGPSFRPELQLERKDNNGNYEPSNCIWVNRYVQSRNRRTNHILKIKGVSKTVTEWSEKSGVKLQTILRRIRADYPNHRLLEPPAPSRWNNFNKTS